MSDNTTVSSGTPIAGLLGVAFIVLKLTHYIDWDWVWVLGPFWIPFAIVCLMWLIPLTLLGLVAIFRR